jgi:eukaryotic-like serine/threonine-protein kinase
MSLWKETKVSDPAIVVPLLRMILEGIKDIHAARVIHRDLKPQNIHINLTTFKPHIIDFGLSLLLDDKVTAKSYKRCGTMGYMAP